MARNDFLVFGGGSPPNDGGPSANTLSNVNYASLAARTTGFQSGIAQSIQLNKVWRQASIMSAMLGNFLNSTSNLDAIDDGTVATLTLNFIAAVQNVNRFKATGPFNLYVSPSGNDTNTGFSPSIPVRTPQLAADILTNRIDLAGNTATIHLLAGTYTTGISVRGPVPGQITPIIVDGGGVATISSTSNCISSFFGGQVTAQNMTLTSSGAGINGVLLYAGPNGSTNGGAGLNLGAAPNGLGIVANGAGAILQMSNNFTISGSTANFAEASSGGVLGVNGGITITLSGSPTSNPFVNAVSCGVINWPSNSVFSGASGGGTRFLASLNGVIGTSGSNPATYFPGSTAGVLSFGGQYT